MSSDAELVDGRQYDLIVVGLGAMGSAALLSGAQAGLRVLGIDRHDPPHALGSSHAESRITRLAVGEGPQYLPFVRRSHEIWRDLEARTGVELLFQPGGYTVCQPAPDHRDRWGDFVTRTADVAGSAGIEFERRSADDFGRHLPDVRLDGDEIIGFEPTGGIVLCERAISVQLELARAAGADILTDTGVDDVTQDGDSVVVSAGSSVATGAHVIVATGAWFRDLAPDADAARVTVTRQVVYWFAVDEPARFDAHTFPFIIWAGDRAEDYLGVFPMVPGGVPGLKVLGEQFVETTDPATVDRHVSDDEISTFHRRFVAPRLLGVRSRCVRAEVCLYTNTPDDHFLIDTDPDADRVLYASPCSGHGFKHSAALGEAMVQWLVNGRSDLDLAPFTRDRFSRS